MLTAIRDFVADAFGRGQQSELEAIQYSGQHILIEAAEHVYLAAVVQGIEPAGFRSALRDLAIEIENRYRYLLHSYQGDASAFAALDLALGSLAGDAPASAGSRLTHRQPPKRRTGRRSGVGWRLLAGLLPGRLGAGAGRQPAAAHSCCGLHRRSHGHTIAHPDGNGDLDAQPQRHSDRDAGHYCHTDRNADAFANRDRSGRRCRRSRQCPGWPRFGVPDQNCGRSRRAVRCDRPEQ